MRARHQLELLEKRPSIEWVEVHSKNYFARHCAQRKCLERIRPHYGLSLHPVGLSLCSTDPLQLEHLQRLAGLVHDLEPLFVSEHLSWSSIGGRFANDLLPLPCTEEALHYLIARVSAVQEFLKRQILVENVSSYLRFNSILKSSTIARSTSIICTVVRPGTRGELEVADMVRGMGSDRFGFRPHRARQPSRR